MKLFIIASAIFAQSILAASAADLKITQVGGTLVEVRNVRIDYTQYSIFYTPDVERLGIRALMGAGQVTVYWTNVLRIEIAAATSKRLPATLFGKDGRTTAVELVGASGKELQGDTELGDFFIDLGQIRLIEVIKSN